MDAALAAIVGTVAGGLIAVVGSLTVALLQIKHQKTRDQAERVVAHRREFVTPLDSALGELVALAVQEVPQLLPNVEDWLLDPDTWPVDWKNKLEEQSTLRERINRLALMSPYPSTLEHARAVVERIDQFAEAQTNYEQLYEAPSEDDLRDWFSKATENEKKAWLANRDSSFGAIEESRKVLLDATYGFRRHLERLLSEPDADPDDYGS